MNDLTRAAVRNVRANEAPHLPDVGVLITVGFIVRSKASSRARPHATSPGAWRAKSFPGGCFGTRLC